MEFIPVLTAIALVLKGVEMVKHLRAGLWNDVATQAASWGFGIAVAFLLALSDFGAAIQIADHVLADLNAYSLILFGTSLGASGSLVYDHLKAKDIGGNVTSPKLLSGDRV